VAYIYNPKLTPVELLQTVCQEFGISLPDPPPDSLKPWTDALNQFLLAGHAAGQQFVLIVDEAQALSAELLELLRLLTNLETQERKLLQIVLVGQPELRDKLARPELEQLSQRVIARVHLGPMQRAETADYVRHRLGVAGLTGEQPFSDRALALVHRLSGGVPRRINLLCQRALLGAYASGVRRIGPAIVRQAASEVFAVPATGRRPWAAGALVLLLVVAVGTAAWWWSPGSRPERATRRPQAGGRCVTGRSRQRQLPLGVGARRHGPAAHHRRGGGLVGAGGAVAAGCADRVDPCGRAHALALDCHDGSADIALLRRLDRPVLLHGPDGGRLLLLALGREAAVVQGAGGEQRLPLAALQAAWDRALQHAVAHAAGLGQPR
jgi:general secretion pathway protein A